MDHHIYIYIIAGFVAQLIDGALGMAYGVSASSLLMGFGVPPQIVSSTVHAAECFTTGASAISHHAFGNISRDLFRRLLIPGIIGAALGDRLGRAGMVIVSTVAGFVDAHATTASIATLTHSGRLPRDQAALSVVAALSSNTVTKIVMASLSRDVGYALRLSAGVIAIAAAAWLGLFVAAL